MKIYKQILEAINKGILLALDDFDDEEQVLNIKSKLNNHRDYTKEYLDLMNEVVDLGLPSGTLWCKYNLGVDSNQLTKPQDWYGDYYAWGELEPKNTKSDWTNYKFGEDHNKLTKYCNNPKYGLNGFEDNLTQLLPEDDTAYLNKKLHNYKFHMPTKELFEELKYTDNYWVNNYDPNKIEHNPKNDKGIKGLNGRIFEGKNGNQLFIPAASFYAFNGIYEVGSKCNIWSSSLALNDTNCGYLLNFESHFIRISDNRRCCSLPIRPVINL